MLDKILIGATGFVLGRTTGTEAVEQKEKTDSLEHRVQCFTQELYLLEDCQELFMMYVNEQLSQDQVLSKIGDQVDETQKQLKRLENQLKNQKIEE